MLRKLLSLALCVVTLLTLVPMTASADYLSIGAPAETVRPGKAIVIVFESPAAGTAVIQLVNQKGEVVSVVTDGYQASSGRNEIWWNGTWQGIPAPEGGYTMTVEIGGEKASAPVHVGGYAPYMYNVMALEPVCTTDEPVNISLVFSVGGTFTGGVLLPDGTEAMVAQYPVQSGEHTVTWDGTVDGQRLPAGDYSYTLTLTDDTGFDSTEEHITVTVTDTPSETATPEPTATPAPTATPEPAEEEDVVIIDGSDVVEEVILTADGEEIVLINGVAQTAASNERPFTPSYTSPYDASGEPLSYWNLPMDITNEAAIWEVLMAPMTVVDGNERDQASLYAEPSTDSEVVGLVTCETQGVRVIETLDNGWSLVECYSSSFYGTKIEAWNILTQGYIKTSRLKQVKPATEYGIIVDKFTQRLYIFKEGKLWTTLLVSTGLANAKQPFNETRSGEFFLTSPVGDFKSDSMTCGMALRFNDGDLLHEVPYVTNADGTKNFGYTEPKLGTKASHGCIRVQRKKSPEGVNQAWLWNNRNYNTRILIWEDWQGRQMEYPVDAVLYYNAKGGSYYHSQDFCYSATNDGVVLSPFSWTELDNEPYASLKFCPYCGPLLRRAQIDEINERYAPGGDHDPIMTEARREWYESHP